MSAILSSQTQARQPSLQSAVTPQPRSIAGDVPVNCGDVSNT